ncbi:MAG TPA: zeta toxin family protein [Candidatus Saccharimonadia bacterium]|nr:zeta toxin family protein [Candidatus Saccharimonadia bacterium]
MNPYAHMSHPIAILIRGLPGSGKSYLAAALAEAFGKDATVMLDPDSVDQTSQEYKDHVAAQTAEGVDPALHLYRFSRAKAYKGIDDHKIIMWNQPFTNLEVFNKMADRLKEHAGEQQTPLPILVVEITISPEVAKQRVEQRKQSGGHGPSENTFSRFVNDYTTFANDGYDVVTVQGDADTTANVALVLDRVKSLI